MGSVLAGLRSKSEPKPATLARLKRHDSGYDSTFEDDEISESSRRSKKGHRCMPLPTNTTQLEFSNYAHVDVQRRGAKSSKRYDFEYWGDSYTWKRVIARDGDFKEVSYHLVNSVTGAAVAHIVPTPLTTSEAREEEEKGGWVPPCSMWISDEKIIRRGLTDVAE